MLRPARIALLLALVVPALTLVPGPAGAVPVTLQNDGFVGGSAAFQAGFVTGEIAASRFDPPGPFPMPLTEVRFLFGDIQVQTPVVLHVWEDTGAYGPGTEIYTEAYLATGSASALNSIDLTAAGVQVNGPFRVGLEFTQDGLPCVARDTDGTIAATQNFIMANGIGWVPSNLLGVTGDWVIRATVDVVETSTEPAPSVRQSLVLAPNPFNPATEVRFELPAAGPVTARVYDLKGRQVDVLMDGEFMAAGPQAVPYRADLPSGVYLMRVWSGRWAETAKFTVLE